MSKTVYRSGKWAIDPQNCTVSHQENGVQKLKPVSMELLEVFVLHPGEVLSKDFLMQKVWSDRNVTDNSLNQAIADIRRAFGDNFQESKILKTVPKKGYSFLLVVEAKKALSEGDLPFPRHKNRWLVPILVGVVLGVLGLWSKTEDPGIHPVTSSVAPGGQVGLVVYPHPEGYLYSFEYEDRLKQSDGFLVKGIRRPIHAWSHDGRYLVYDSTVQSKAYYAFNVFDLSSKQVEYFKASKSDAVQLAEEIPTLLTKEVTSVDSFAKNVVGIHSFSVPFRDGQSITITLLDGEISSFLWQ